MSLRAERSNPIEIASSPPKADPRNDESTVIASEAFSRERQRGGKQSLLPGLLRRSAPRNDVVAPLLAMTLSLRSSQ